MSEPSKVAMAAAEKWYRWVPPELTSGGRAVINDLADVIQGVIDAAVLAEREKCAKVAANHTLRASCCGLNIAEEIRDLPEEPADEEYNGN